MTRAFDDRPAIREKTPILVGLVGPSGGGKTFSALRLASGMQRVTGGDIFVIDTEARRALHYAERFKFRHVAFGQPFSPLDYLEAIQHCLKKGATNIVVDSMSHEHEGPGGVLDMHDAELDRMAGKDYDKRNRMTMLAWGKPKAQRRRLINSILQMEANFLFCFRAKQKVKLEKGKEPESQGFMPIAGEEFVYEMTLKCLLMPGANGIPTWRSDMIGEKAMIKLPEQFKSTFEKAPQLTEDIGEQLAKWAAGASGTTSIPTTSDVTCDALIARYEACSDGATMRSLEAQRRDMWGSLSKADKERMKVAKEAADLRVESPPPPADAPNA